MATVGAEGSDYPGVATWTPAGPTHFLSGRPGAIQRIVIHDVEDNDTSDARDRFLDATGTTSAHYVVDRDGSILQMVREGDTANDAGSLAYNGYGIGVEHAGYAAYPVVGYFNWTFPDALYEASAKLVAHLALKYGVPIDRDHIVGHYQVPTDTLEMKACAADAADCGGVNRHTDPGARGGNWDWDGYMARVKKYAGGAGAGAPDPQPSASKQKIEVRGNANVKVRWLVQCSSGDRQVVWRTWNADARGVRPATAAWEQARVGDCGAAKVGHPPIVIRGFRRADVPDLRVVDCASRSVYRVDGEMTWNDAAGEHTNAVASYDAVDEAAECGDSAPVEPGN